MTFMALDGGLPASRFDFVQDSRDIAAPQQSVIHLLEAVIPAIVTPLHKTDTVINARAVLAPLLETGMCSRKRCG